MRRLFITLLVTFCIATCYAQTDLTTFILVRHAEKADDGTRNPGLTDEGKDRAERLNALLKEAGVSAIYTTPYKRTTSTVVPLSESLGLEVQQYDPRNMDFLDEIMKNHKGGTIVVSGHSNTTPFVANKLLGKEQFKQLSEKEYGMIFMVTISEVGKGTVNVLKY